MEVWLYLIRIAFILLILLFIHNIISAIQRDIEDKPVKIETEPVQNKLALKLEVVKGAEKIKLIKNNLDSLEEITLGREMNNDIMVDDIYVSSNHFIIKKYDNVFVLEDLNSTNGTFLNNKLINAPAKLRHNDTISLGDVKFRINIHPV